jgi:hypothetical protein
MERTNAGRTERDVDDASPTEGVSQNRSTSGDHVIAPPWKCSRQGHEFTDIAGPQPHLCLHCPTIGAPCPDCGVKGQIVLYDESIGRCSRCDGTGWIEYAEIRHGELAARKLDAKRFAWLVDKVARMIGTKSEQLIPKIDALMRSGAGMSGPGGFELSVLFPETLGKTPSPSPRPVRTSGNGPRDPSPRDDSTLSEKSKNA